MTSNDQNDLISVIVPVYKVEPYLDRCVRSIVSQTYKNLEIILVDDGSPDNCPAMCDAWAERDSRIKVIHKENGGLSDARNAGMDAATGEYIAFVDSDDWVENHFIEWLYMAIITEKAQLSACEVKERTGAELRLEYDEREPVITRHSAEEAMDELTKGIGFRAVVWNKLYNKELLRGESFAVGKLHEDEFFSYRIIDKCSNLAFIHRPLYNYFQREGSIMTLQSMGHLDILEAYCQRVEFFKTKYKSLYLRDKILVCTTCVNLFCEVLKGRFVDSDTAAAIVKDYRRRIRFRAKEIMRCSPKKLLYIAGSSPMLIESFSKWKMKRNG